MSYAEYLSFIEEKGILRTGTQGGEIALNREDTLKSIEYLSDTDIGILGGDIYKLEDDGYLYATYDSWYCDRTDTDSFILSSRNLAIERVKNYREPLFEKIMYVLVLDDIEQYH